MGAGNNSVGFVEYCGGGEFCVMMEVGMFWVVL